MRPWMSVPILLSCLATGASAAEGLIDATDAGRFARAIQDIGYQAKLETDSVGDPMIRSKISKSNYFIYFYDCKDHKGCGSVTLKTSYDMSKKPVAIQKINEWNTKRRFGSAYLDADGDPNLQLSVNLFGGVTSKNLEDTLDFWRSSVTEFEKMIDW